ncbi:outer membrane protein OmpU [Gemmobacter aquatilis]|uniref:Outer membrane protein OmpU n=1 Tax=Gemmobacter aquatilis TaxID=933059 RepID=A0A1H8JHY9_9RHOB|nr:porin [Gemmobacter aquatilis]SEN80423.1 outer membrane protein OmpU [Gemmobacter aquatilis]
MKKILLATTILVGTAGFAAAEVTLSGSSVFGLGYWEAIEEGNDTFSVMETYLTATATVQSDAGLEFGFEQTFGTYSTEDARAGDGISNDGTSVYVSGAFGKLSFGSVEEANDFADLPDIGGLNGLGVDDVAELYSDTGDNGDLFPGLGYNRSSDINYTGTFGAFTIGLSTNLNGPGDDTDDSSSIGLNYNFGDGYVGLGYVNTENFGEAMSLYAGGTFSGVTVNAMYTEFDPELDIDKQSAYGIYAAYTTGALTLSAEVADADAFEDTSYGFGASYDLGGGAAVVGGIGSVAGTTRAEAGVSFEF